MLAQYLDLAEEANANSNTVVIDVSNYDYCLVQPIGAAASFQSTIDSGAIQGVSDGSAVSAANFVDAYGLRTNGATSTSLNTAVADGGIIKFNVVGRYIKITCDDDVSKLLVMLTKIS
jgi:hypothetical protein